MQNTSLSETYSRYLEHVAEVSARVRRGEHAISPDGLWLRSSENCNLKCVGCWTPDRFKKVYMTPQEAEAFLTSDGNFKYISVTGSEAFMNAQLCDILELCKEKHPDAITWIISNGTIPIKGRYRRAVSLIDRLGLSVDGATKEVYERVRRGAIFERFVENVREIVKVRAETGNPRELGFSFTAMEWNYHELPGVIRLAHELGIPAVWAQPMMAKLQEITERVGDHLIDKIPQEEQQRILAEAEATAAELGVNFNYSAGLKPSGEPITPLAEEAVPSNNQDEDLAIRMCQYTWGQSFTLFKDGGKHHVHPCCYMPRIPAEIENEYGFVYDDVRPADQIFNSDGFWRFREDLASGKIAHLCKDCPVAKGYPWKEPEPVANAIA